MDKEVDRAAILEVDPEKGTRRLYASGLRNPNGLGWAPVDVSRRLREALWEGGPTAILVSATLTTEGDFGFVRDRLGLRGVRELAVGSPFDYAEQALLHLPRGLPDPRTPRAL